MTPILFIVFIDFLREGVKAVGIGYPLILALT